jgi:agmatine deiminase
MGCGSGPSEANAPASSADDRRWRMPAEEAPHARTWMCWPSSREIWGDVLDQVQRDIADVANTIATFEPVRVLARPGATEAARRLLDGAIELISAPVDDLWARDTLPCFLIDADDPNGLAATTFNFNGWGDKQLHDGDATLAAQVARHEGVALIDSGIVGEGGGVEVDGHGAAIACESSWVNPNRNPNLDREQITRALERALGVERVLWLTGIRGQDITDGHVDTLARFADQRTILREETGTRDVWGAVARRTAREVERLRTGDNRPYEVAVVHQPSVPDAGPDFLSSYVNYYVCNGGVIAPAFGDRAADDRAAGVLRELYPEREVVQVRIDGVASGGGGIHCATQQQPG